MVGLHCDESIARRGLDTEAAGIGNDVAIAMFEGEVCDRTGRNQAAAARFFSSRSKARAHTIAEDAVQDDSQATMYKYNKASKASSSCLQKLIEDIIIKTQTLIRLFLLALAPGFKSDFALAAHHFSKIDARVLLTEARDES